MQYVIALKQWNSATQTAETVAVVRGGKRFTLRQAARIVRQANAAEGYRYGGFGQYYDWQRAG